VAFIIDANLRIQKVLGLQQVKQQLANIQVGGIGQINKVASGLGLVSKNASGAAEKIFSASKATKNLGSAAGKTGSQLKDGANKAKNFGDQIFLAGKRYAAFLSATVGAFKAFQLISEGAKSVVEFDQALVSLAQIIGTTVDNLGNLRQQFLDLSVATGTSASDIANAAKLLAQAGFRGRELTEAVEQLAKTPLTPIFESMEQAVAGAVAALEQFSDEGLTVETVFDKLTKVSNNYAASFPDIIEGIRRGGSAFQAIGGNLDEFIAAFTTIRSVTQESASAVGTSLKTISSRLADPKIIDFLQTKNIRLIEEGQFVGPIEAIRRIGEGLDKVKTTQEAVNIATQLGGRRQISRFLALAKNVDTFNEILGVSETSFGEFDRVAEQGLQAVSKQIDVLISQAKKLAIDLGSDLFLPVIKGLNTAATAAIGLLDALKPIIPALGTIGAAFAGGALFRGLSAFGGSQIGRLAGPAAFSAAGGRRAGVTAGITASPFAQAGLLIAASEAAASLTKTALGADSFTATLITSIASITAAIALFRNQTIAQFAAGGGIFTSLGKKGILGGLAGSLATIGTLAVPLALSQANKSAKELSDKIIDSAIQSISEIQIDKTDPKSVTDGVGKLFDVITNSVDELTNGVDIKQNPSILKFFEGVSRAIGNALEGDFSGLVSRGGLTRRNVDSQIQKLLKQSSQITQILIDNIAADLGDSAQQIARPGRVQLIQQGVQNGLTVEESAQFASSIIESVGGIDAWTEKIRKSAETIAKETKEREKVSNLVKNFLPNRLVGQLSQFSKAVDKTVNSINNSAQLFQSQIAEIAGGIRAPSFDFQFNDLQVKDLIQTGGLNDLFQFTPDIPKFVGAFSEIENLLDQFVLSVSNVSVPNVDISSTIDQFFASQSNVPQTVRDNFEEFFTTIGNDLASVSTGKFIDANKIKERFREEFQDIGAGATDSVVQSVRGFLQATFKQIEDEANRLATVRQFEIAAPVRPESQAAFLEQQLRRVGITAPSRTQGNQVRGTIEELDLIRRELESRSGPGNIPGRLPTPGVGFFRGRDQRLVDIAGNERVRQEVRDQFKGIITESSALKQSLAELKPGTEGFIEASNRARELARSTVELQTTLEALDKATGQALKSELETLSRRQQFETAQTRATLAEQVRTGAIDPLQAERRLFDLSKEQQKEQLAVQDKFDAIVEKDNSLRVDLAKQVSENTKTQQEIIADFGTSASLFADSTKIQATSIQLMQRSIIDFGQSVVDFSNFNSIGPTTSQGNSAEIIPSQIRSGGITVQQGFDEFNRLIKEGNTSQQQMTDILEAIYERQDQIKSTSEESNTIQRDQEKNAAVGDKISQLNESLDNLRNVLSSPNELRIVSDQRVVLDLSTLPDDIVNEVKPLFEEAGIVIAKTVTRQAMESLAAKTDSEVSISAGSVAQELA